MIAAFLAIVWNLLCSRYPDLIQNFIKIISQNAKYKKSRLDNIDISEIQNGVMKVLEQEKQYKDPNFSLAKMANEIGITVYQLSEYLNNNVEIGFSKLVGIHRCKEAKKLLLSTNTSITDIAFEVGYNSLSSFNRGYKNIYNITPTASRNQDQNKKI